MIDDDLGRAFGDASPEAWLRLGRYLDGRCPPEERRAVESWLAEDPRRQEFVQQIRRARVLAEAAPGLWDVDAAWARLARRLDEEEGRAATGRWVHRLAPALRVAAAIAVLLGGAVLWRNRAAFLGPSNVPVRELVAGVGQQMRITLGDGTRVVLGPASRLRFPGRFRRIREVQLQGEAVFDVAPDPARPFRVRAGASVTEVLGTRFGIRAYPEDGYVHVVVAEGRVAVSGMDGTDAGPALQLTPGLAVRVEPDGTLGRPTAVSAEDFLAWTEGRLVFDAAPLAEVARALGRRYGVRVALAEPDLAALRLTAEFRRATAAEVIDLIARSLGLGYRRTPDGFLFFRTTPTATGAPVAGAPLLSTDGGPSR